MSLEDLKNTTEDLKKETKGFIETNIAYYKLWFFKVATKSTTMLLKILLLTVIFVMVIMFFSIAGALALGYLLDNFVYGFLIVGGIYLILGILIYKIQDKIVEGPILEKFSEIYFND